MAAAVTWSFVWLDSMSETKTWKRLTCANRKDNRGNEIHYFDLLSYVDLKKKN